MSGQIQGLRDQLAQLQASQQSNNVTWPGGRQRIGNDPIETWVNASETMAQQYTLPNKNKRVEVRPRRAWPCRRARRREIRAARYPSSARRLKKYGIDPVTALKVAKSEGLAQFYGDGGASGGAFQLYTKGGLGNEFQKETGLNPLDKRNEDATIDYAMKRASQGGWGPWYGAAKVGVGQWDGIKAQDAPDRPHAQRRQRRERLQEHAG